MSRTWLITGSSRGFGLELTRAVLESGDWVLATARRPEQLTDLLAGFGGRSRARASMSPIPWLRGPRTGGCGNELKGIPQHGITLGNPNAPVTLVWFGDLQCPICREFHAAVFSTLVNNYVRTGKVKLVWRNLAFIGPDSTTAAQVAGAAGLQNRIWQFVSLFYYNQQEENSGYVTPSFLKEIASGAGVNWNKANTDRYSPTMSAQMAAANQLANNTLPQIATPSFLLGKTGTTPRTSKATRA